MSADRFSNYQIRHQEAGISAHHFNERHGLVTSYDPKTHLAKVTFQPDGEESSWLPIEEGHSGNGWGILVGLSAGSGQGSGMGGAGSGGGSGGGGSSGGSSSGAGGGSGGATGGSGGQQYQGDQVSVRYQEGDLESGMIIRRIHNDTDRPPKVESGEMLFMHSLGSRMFYKKDGSIHIYGKTSKQDDQNGGTSGSGSSGSGSSSSGSGSGSGSSSGQGTPLKNAPPLQPQTYKMKVDPKGVTTISHFQQQQGGSGGSGGSGGQSDPPDPTSTQSPPNYSTMTTDPTQLKHTHTTYQKGQGQQSSGGGKPQPDTTQGDPAMDSQNQSQPKMFSQTVHDTQKGQLHHTTYDQQGNKKHQIIFDTTANKVTLQTFQQGGQNPQHQVLMDQNSGHLICQTCGGGGGQQAQIVLDQQGNITKTAKGKISMHAQGGFQTVGSWNHQGGYTGDVVNASISMSAPAGSVPGPTPGTAGGQAGPIGAASFIGSGSSSSTSA